MKNQPISEHLEEKVNKSVHSELSRELLNQMHTYAIEAQKDPSNSEVFAVFVKESIERIWSDGKSNKQTCGFCVEPISLDHNNIPESVYKKNIKESKFLKEMMRKDEEDGIYIRTVTHCPTCGAECTVKGEGETHYYRPKENKLREAAEKVVKYCDEWDETPFRLQNVVEELEKALLK